MSTINQKYQIATWIFLTLWLVGLLYFPKIMTPTQSYLAGSLMALIIFEIVYSKLKIEIREAMEDVGIYK